MLVYRVIPYLPKATEGEPGSPLYLHPAQGESRLDNPSHYRVWYLAQDESGAVGETFGNLAVWSEDMFAQPQPPNSIRSLVTYMLPDDLSLLDLDSPKALLMRGLRPTQVVERNRAVTQEWALDVFLERNNRGERLWSGVKWWSYHRPQWRVIGYWGEVLPKVLNVENLSLDHPAVIDAATALEKSRVSDAGAASELVTSKRSKAATNMPKPA